MLTFSLMIENVVVGWHLYALTKDPLSLGFLGLAEAIPAVGFALYAGYWVDKSDKRKVLLACYTVFIMCTLALIYLTSFAHHLFSIQSIIILIYVVIFLSGIARSFAPPAGFSLFGIIIPKRIIAKASSQSSAAWQAGAVIGPVVSGFLYYYIGIFYTLWIVFAGIMVCFGIMYQISDKPPIAAVSAEESIWSNIKEGIHFVRHHPIILPALTLDLFSVLFGGAVSILPIFAAEILNVGAQGLGILRAAPGIGAIFILYYLSRFPIREKLGIKLLFSVGMFGVCMLIFGISTSFYISVCALFFSGLFDGVSVATRSIILQKYTPDNMRGRVSSVNNMFISSSNEIGGFESGVAAKLLGTVPSVVFGSLLTIAIVAFTAYKAQTLRRLQS